MSDSEYQKKQDGDNTEFVVTPASSPKHVAMLTVGIMYTLILFGMSQSMNFGIVATLFVLSFGAFTIYLGLRDSRPKVHRSQSTFRVSSNTVESNGRSFNKDDIHRFIIRNGMSKTELRSYGMVSAGATSNMIISAQAAARQFKQRVATVAHSLELETGGKAYVLAGGMSETTAYGLMRDVGKILGI